MTGKQIQRLRQSLGESTEEFGRRLFVSGRTVEDWEQERHQPSRLATKLIQELNNQTKERK